MTFHRMAPRGADLGPCPLTAKYPDFGLRASSEEPSGVSRSRSPADFLRTENPLVAYVSEDQTEIDIVIARWNRGPADWRVPDQGGGTALVAGWKEHPF